MQEGKNAKILNDNRIQTTPVVRIDIIIKRPALFLLQQSIYRKI